MNIRDRFWSGKEALLALGVVVMLTATGPAAFAQETTPSSLPPGWVAPMSTGLLAEPALVRKLVNASDASMNGSGEGDDGPYAEFGNMVTGAGWISAGPGYRRYVLEGRALVDASAAVSWNLYKVAQARFVMPRLAHDRLSLGGQAIYQDLLQVDYFGLGIDSRKADRSAYRLNNTDLLGYATVQATSWFSVSGRFGWIHQPNLSTATGRNVTVPNTIDLFSETSAPGIRTQPSFLHADVSVAADWRDHPGHPTTGGLYRTAAASYSDRDAGTDSFRRYEVEASQFVPLFTRKWVLALHGWEVFSDTSSGDVVPFYLMPSLGGQNTLRGYYDYRFHDNDMQSFNAESRWALFAHVDAAVFVDAGKVASRAGDLDFKHLKKSYGAGLRVHNSTSTLGRLDIGHSTEGWRVFFKISDPFKRSTPASGRSTVIPFVP
jgi:surface antigen Omp85-like protein